MSARPLDRWHRHTVAVALLAACGFPHPLASQAYTRTDAWRWARYTSADGLPDNHVTALVVTPSGRVWAGTSAGTAWFDGYRWRVPTGAPAVRSLSLAAGAGDAVVAVINGDLYRGDTAGLARVDLRGLPSGTLSAAVPFDRGLAVAAGGRLWRVRNGTVTPLPAPFGREEPVELLRAASGGGLWVATARALYHGDGEHWSVRLRSTHGRYSISDLADGLDGGLLYVRLPDADRGLWFWNGGGLLRREAGESRSQIVAMAAGPSGEFATSSGFSDIRVGRRGRWRTLELPVDAASAQVLAYGPDGDLWIGTEGGVLLYRRSATRWTYWTHPRGDLRNEVSGLLAARDGSMWVATADGVEVHEANGRVRWIREAAGVRLGSITALGQDREGGIWVGSGSVPIGALRFDGRRWRRYGAREGLGAELIHRIVPDQRGRLWFLGLGTLEPGVDADQREPGAFVLDHGRFTAFGAAQGLPNGRLYAFAEAPDSTLLFGTSAGLSALRRGAWTHWTMRDGLKSDRVFAVAVDSGGRVWFAHQHGGLGYLDDAGRPVYHTEADGLVNDQVWAIAACPDSVLWVATWGGLARYQAGHWMAFGVGDGLTNLHVWPIACEGSQVYVGTQGGGTNVLDLRDLRHGAPRVTPEAPIVEGHRALLRWRAHAQRGRLPSHRIATRYRVDDGVWSAWTTDRSATLREVHGGTHRVTFEAAGLQAGPPSSVLFRVSRPAYQRPGVFVPFGLLLLVLAGALWSGRGRRRLDAERRRQLEEQLRQAQKLEAVGQLTSGIAHDMNNVLGIVLAGVQAMRHGLPDATGDVRAGMLDIERAAQRGAAMVRKLVGFSRRAELVMVPTDLGDLVDTLVPMVRRVLPASIEVVTEVARPVPTARVDPVAVEQILWNLATNARDAMPEGGLLRLRVATAPPDAAAAPRGWRPPVASFVGLSVSDTGSGMDVETQSRIYEPFFTTKKMGEGSGLGMAMVYGLMKQHGGHVDVISAEGRGTTVTLRFPATPDPQPEASTAAAPTAATLPRGHETILMVEDEPILRRTAVRILERLGYRVLAAADGAEGLALYQANREAIALVVTDLVMPNLGGRSMYDAMCAEGAPPRIVFTTGYGVWEVADLHGFGTEIPVLHKPWTIDELAQEVRGALDRDMPDPRRVAPGGLEPP